MDYEESDSDESWTTESAISSEAILGSMCMNGGEEKPFACPVPGCKKRYKVKVPPHLVWPPRRASPTPDSSPFLLQSADSPESAPLPCRLGAWCPLGRRPACKAFGGLSTPPVCGAVGQEDCTFDILQIHVLSVRIQNVSPIYLPNAFPSSWLSRWLTDHFEVF